MASTYLYRQTTVPTSEKKFTFSTWMKVNGRTGADSGIIEWYRDTNNKHQILIDSTSSKLRCSSVESSTTKIDIRSDAVFRDPSAWYHIVIHSDTTPASASDRFKLWVNGVAQTFSTYTWNYTQSVNINVFDGTAGDAVNLGVRNEIASNSFDGSMADTYYIDGSLIAHTEFGQTDSTTGIWKPNLSPTIGSFGNAGFHLKYENSGNMGLDSSGNSLNMSVSGTMTQTVDTPSNNFATFNPLFDPYSSSISFSNGNLRVDQDVAGWGTGISSLGVNTGKWYAEFKATSVASNGMTAGIVEEFYPNNLNFVGDTGSIGYHYNGTVYNRGSSSAFGDSYAQGDIIGVAMDLTNGYVYFSKNGTFQNSGDPTSGPSGTGGISIGGTSGSIYFLGQSINASGYHGEANFGNGYFGTTAVASAGTNAGGIGTFEYDVPSGYYALCTKQINTYG